MLAIISIVLKDDVLQALSYWSPHGREALREPAARQTVRLKQMLEIGFLVLREEMNRDIGSACVAGGLRGEGVHDVWTTAGCK